LVRPSGTENLIRVMVEGENEKEIAAYVDELAECIRKNMEE
jgi:phosphomannomutase